MAGVLEKSLNDSDIKIQQFERRLNFFVSQAAVIITVTDKQGTILYQTSSIKQILGYEPGSRIGHNFLRSRLVHPDDVSIKEQLLHKAHKHPNKNFSGELRMRHKNGTWSWMEVTFNNQLRNPDIGGIVMVTHDITDRKQLELQKNEFLSMASHELRTPLTTIRVYSQLLITKFGKDEKNNEKVSFLKKIITQADKIAQLITELMDVSKIQEGKLSVHAKPLMLYPLLKKIIEDFTYMSQTCTIKLTGSARLSVLGDEGRIGQVVNNLLTNAIKYSPPSGGIRVHSAREGNEVVISVTDEGKGIPLRQQKYVFNRFFRIEDGTSPQTSSGLGLYIASEIIKLHKGRIWLKSKKGHGSTFYFSLPVYTRSQAKFG